MAPKKKVAATKATATKVAATKTKEVVKVEEPGVPAVGIPAISREDAMAMLAQHAGEGLENVGADDITTPFLSVLSGQSPQVEKASPKYVEGAKAGMIFNNVTNSLHEDLEVVVCGYERSMMEWQQGRKGFIGKLRMNSVRARTAIRTQVWENGKSINKLFVPACDGAATDGSWRADQWNELVETATFVVLAKMEGEWAPCIINMKSTQLKVARAWCSRMSGTYVRTDDGKRHASPSYTNVYKVSTASDSKDDFVWSKWVVDSTGQTIADLPEFAEVFQEAAALSVLVRSQEMDVDFAKEDTQAPTPVENEGAAQSGGATEEMPY